jgi:5'-3' exonuclease
MINILIDGNYFFHKTFGIFGGYGPKDPAEVLKTQGEQSMFIRKIATDLCASLKLLPTGGRLIFTTDSKSWRKDVEIEDGGYKSNRIKDENVDWSIFFSLMQGFGQHLEKMGFVYSKIDGAEGDDLLYFWANHFNSLGEDCIIISGDKDMHQLARNVGKNWTVIWNSNSKNNMVSVPVGWKEDWLELKESVSIFDMSTAMSPDREKMKEFVNKIQIEEIRPRDFIFMKMLTGDKGDAVPGIWEFEQTPGKTSKLTPKKAEQILESMTQSKWKESNFDSLLEDDEFLDWVSGYSLRLMKDVDSTENRKKAASNLKRNYTLMWLDESVIPSWVTNKVHDEISRGISLPRKPVSIDRIKILEGTEWVNTQSAPKTFDPFANFN